MLWQIKLFFALFIVVVAGLFVFKYTEAIEDVAELQALREQDQAALKAKDAALATQAGEMRALLAYNEVLAATLAEKQSYDEAIRKQLGGVHRKLNILMEDDPVAQEWSATPLPDSVRGVLRDHAAKRGGASDVRAPGPAPDGSHPIP